MVLTERFYRYNIDRAVDHNLTYRGESGPFYERWVWDDLVVLNENNKSLFAEDILPNYIPSKLDASKPLEQFGCAHLLDEFAANDLDEMEDQEALDDVGDVPSPVNPNENNENYVDEEALASHALAHGYGNDVLEESEDQVEIVEDVTPATSDLIAKMRYQPYPQKVNIYKVILVK